MDMLQLNGERFAMLHTKESSEPSKGGSFSKLEPEPVSNLPRRKDNIMSWLY